MSTGPQRKRSQNPGSPGALAGCDESTDIDVLVGEPAYAGRGLGAPLVQRFLREVVFRDPRYSTCVIDPHEANVAAIRAYAKAGFRHVRTVVDPDDATTRLHLMQWP